MRTLQSTHTLRSHYLSLGVSGYKGSKVCSVTNGRAGGRSGRCAQIKLKYADARFPQSDVTSSKVINTVTTTGVAGRARSSEQNDNHMRN